MLRVLGRASSINVRKVLWTCAEIGLPFEREDWGQGFRSPDGVRRWSDTLAARPGFVAQGHPEHP